MTDIEVETRVSSANGDQSFQEFLVRDAAEAPVLDVTYRGIDSATPAPGVLDAISTADVLVLAPSNPIASIGPILAVSGMRAAVHDSPAPVVAVTPIVANVPIHEPGEERRARCRRALLAARGLPHTATAVARLFADLLDVFVLDDADSDETEAIAALGLDVRLAPTIVGHDEHAADHLARVVLGTASRSDRP